MTAKKCSSKCDLNFNSSFLAQPEALIGNNWYIITLHYVIDPSNNEFGRNLILLFFSLPNPCTTNTSSMSDLSNCDEDADLRFPRRVL